MPENNTLIWRCNMEMTKALIVDECDRFRKDNMPDSRMTSDEARKLSLHMVSWVLSMSPRADYGASTDELIAALDGGKKDLSDG